ncbi:MAG TPA: hypothetical protein VN428_02530, partial [Bryobacteraceae bacterium]|nr:hypothetical protein [Bryobacteraceae bacterium]
TGGYFAYKHYWQPRQQAIPAAPVSEQARAAAQQPPEQEAPAAVDTPAASAVTEPPAAAAAPVIQTPAATPLARTRSASVAGSSRGGGTPAPAASFTPATPVVATPPRVSEPVATPIERVQEPQAPANHAPPPAPQRAGITRPESPAPPVAPARVIPPPAPAVPKSGTLIWSGQLEKDKVLTIDGASASNGTLRGALPGVPVMVEVTPSTVGVAEMPGPTNGWKRIVLRSRNNSNVVVTVKWTVL